jgi:hypothetical protein
MGNTLASLLVKIGVDTTGFSSGLRSADGSLTNFAKKAEKIGGQMQKLGGLMTLGLTTPILAAGAASIKAASDYEESMNKVKVVFEGSAQAVLDWSKDSATAMGISQSAALEAAGTYGNLFTAQGMGIPQAQKMSQTLVELSADLASFNNAAPDEVLLALRSGLSGEIEPLKRFGVALNEPIMKMKAMEMGLGDNILALTEAQKIQVRYAIIMDQTTKAQGDFARTADGMANSSRILKAQLIDASASLGRQLLPYALQAVQAISKLVTQFTEMSPTGQKVVIVLLAIVAALGPVLSFVGTLLTVLPALGTAFTAIGTFVLSTLLPALGTLAAAFGAILAPLLIVIATVGLVYLAFKNNFGGITTTAKQLAFIIKYYFGQVVDWFKKTFPTMTKWLTKLKDGFMKFINGLKEGWRGLKEWFNKNNPFSQVQEGIKGGKSTIEVAVDSAPAIEAFQQVGMSAEQLEEKMKALSDVNTGFISALESYASFDKSYKQDHKSAVDSVTEAQLKLNEAVNKYGRDSKQAFEAKDALAAAKLGLQELEASWHTSTQKMVYDMITTQFMADGILTDIEAQALVAFGLQSGLFTEEQAKYTQLLIDQANAYVIQTRQTEQLIGTTGNLISKVTALGQAWMIASKNAAVMASSAMRGRGYTLPGSTSSNPKDALGGSVLAGVPITVGEHGMETFVPRTNGTIIPHGEGSGKNQVININIQNPKKESSEESIRRAMKNLSFLGVAS